jgi:hypothetical protein
VIRGIHRGVEFQSMLDQWPDAKDEAFELSEAFLRAVVRWENAPHNQNGQDKTWVERLDEKWREHYRKAVRVR